MNTFRIVIFAIALIFVTNHAKATDLPTSEAWYVYVDNETMYASEHVTKRRLASGDIECRVHSRVLLDLLGNRQEEITDAIYVVTQDLSPVSATVHTKRASGEITFACEKDGDNLQIRRVSNGLSRSSAINLAQHPIFRAMLPDAISHMGAGSKNSEFELAVIDEGSLRVEPVKCTMIDSDNPSTVEWSVEFGSDVVLSRGRLSFKDGQRVQEAFSIPKYRLQQSTAQEASKIEYLVLKGRDMLMFDVDKQIARIDLLQELMVKLRWKDVPLNRLQLNDGRQELVSHKVEGVQHEAVVRIANPNSASPRTAEALEQKDRESLLRKTQYIDPTDSAVLTAASVWTKDCRTPEEIIDALSRNVFEHLQGGEAIAETLTAPEVLQCKKGKCTEYAILFASLARSKDLPTRIVLGDRMINGQWIGHMWNEVFVAEETGDSNSNRQTGRWITVDATTKEIGFAPALLKLTHSDTVLGTQPIRWELADSLHISVESFKSKEADPSENWESGVSDKTYTNAEFGFRVSSPNENWKMTPTVKAGVVEMRLHVPGEDRAMIHCVAVSLPIPFEAKAMIAIRNTKFMATYKEYAVLSNNVEVINEREWQKLQFTRAMGPKESLKFSESKSMKTTEFAFCKGNVLFLVNLIAGDAVHDKHINELQEIMKSLVFR